jgi:hypothetical protein
MSDNSSSSGGIGFAGLLTVLFVGLKLGQIIQWSWLWVLSPLWISFCITISFLGLKLGEVIQWSWLWVLSPLWISFGITISFLLIMGIVYLILHLLK